MTPKLSKVSPWEGLKMLISARNRVEFGKSLVKLGIVVAVAMVVLWPEKEKLP